MSVFLHCNDMILTSPLSDVPDVYYEREDEVCASFIFQSNIDEADLARHSAGPSYYKSHCERVLDLIVSTY